VTRSLKLLRDAFAPTRTLGRLLLDGLPLGFTVEDLDRGLDAADPATWARKVKAATAIPVGTYHVGARFSPAQGREVLWVRDVPAYRWVLLHSGNDEADTEGCILPGMNRTGTGVSRSRVLVSWMERELLSVARAGDLTLTIERDAAAWAAFSARAA
jgi:hypothetical protein